LELLLLLFGTFPPFLRPYGIAFLPPKFESLPLPIDVLLLPRPDEDYCREHEADDDSREREFEKTETG
jgi:hypothetical protein